MWLQALVISAEGCEAGRAETAAAVDVDRRVRTGFPDRPPEDVRGTMGQRRTNGGGASARSLARRLGLPAARGVAAGTLAAAVVLGGGASASAAGPAVGGPSVGGPAVPDGLRAGDPGAVVDESTTAATPAQRLAALGERWSRDRLDDALAVGAAALVAADASTALAPEIAEAEGLPSSVDALRALVRTHDGTTVRQRAGGVSTVLPDSVSAPPALSTTQRLAVVQEIATLAADVFRTALEVEATAASTGPGLPGLDAPPLQLTAPRPLEALTEPVDPPAPVDPAGPDAVPGTGSVAGTAPEVPAQPASAADGQAPVEQAPADPAGEEPADVEDPGPDGTAAEGAGEGPDAVEDPTEDAAGAGEGAGDDAAEPAVLLPAELVDGLAELEAAVAAASGAGAAPLLGLEAQPVLPSALLAAATTTSGTASATAWSSFLPVSWSTLGLENGRIPAELLCAPAFAPTALLRCDAAAALEAVNEAYRADFGEDLVITSAYRTYEQQAILRIAKGWLAAPAGLSNHGLGVAVDLGGFGGLGQFDSPRYRWMLENGEQFGWVHPEAMRPGGGGPPEPWHFEFGTD